MYFLLKSTGWLFRLKVARICCTVHSSSCLNWEVGQDGRWAQCGETRALIPEAAHAGPVARGSRVSLQGPGDDSCHEGTWGAALFHWTCTRFPMSAPIYRTGSWGRWSSNALFKVAFYFDTHRHKEELLSVLVLGTKSKYMPCPRHTYKN